MAKRLPSSGFDTTSAAGIAKASAASPYDVITGLAPQQQAPLGNPVPDPTNTAQGASDWMAAKKAALDKFASSSAAKGIKPVDPNAVLSLNPEHTQTIDPTGQEVSRLTDNNALSKWSLEGDPIYQQAMTGSLTAFNTAKANAMFKLNQQSAALQNQMSQMDKNQPDQARQLAGNFAARGMQRGDYGAYYRAQDKQNAQIVAAQTDIKDQIASLNQDFLSNYGTAGSDWLGTATGQQARQQAIQLALQNRLAQAGANG